MKQQKISCREGRLVRPSGQSRVVFLLAIALASPLVALAGDSCPNFRSDLPLWSTTYNGHTLCFVGSDPRNGPFTSNITTVVIPVELHYLDAKGEIVETSDPTGPLFNNPAISAMEAVLASPIFAPQDFKFGDTDVGTVQWIEATERASFWSYPAAKFHGWHIHMNAFPARRLTLDVPYEDWKTNSVPHFHLVTNALIDDFITDQLPPYEDSLPIFLFYDMGNTASKVITATFGIPMASIAPTFSPRTWIRPRGIPIPAS